MQHLEDSLRRLKTDRLDLWQFHGIQWDDDAELIFAEGGALEAALEAKKAGKVRHIGFTGHKDPDYHLGMLERPFEWETVQMPLNILDTHYRSFQKRVLPECTKRDIGVIGMKALAAQDGRIVKELGINAELLRRYTLSLPISTLVCGIESRENLRQDLAIARDFKPLEPEEIASLETEGEEPAADGDIEQYKVGNFGCDWHHEQA
jgi:predicted aldo/keto reductase-like oxidoreductase